MSDTSEEKTEKPSVKKLRDARKKGQVAQAPDFVQAVATLALVAYIWMRGPDISARFSAALSLATDVTNQPVQQAAGRLVPILVRLSAEILLPIFLLAVASALLASVVIQNGFVFSLEPLKPNLENLHPVKGLKRIFSGKSLANLVKSIVKLIIIGTATGLTVLLTLNLLVQTPICGLSCLPHSFATILQPVVITAVAILLAAGVVDILIQRFFFMKDMRMTKTELKRERMDSDGNPHIKGARRRERNEAAKSGDRLGIRRANVLVHAPDACVGFRYVRGETPVPLIVCRGRSPEASAALMKAARALSIPVIEDVELARAMAEKLKPGGILTEEFFGRVARVLHLARVVG